MRSDTLVKITSIAGLVALEIANLLTAQYDGVILMTIAGIIGGIGGYEIGKYRALKKR